ncbi:MAG: hypothetical protein JJ956_08155 [Pseudomonadales bacterium]|nr:hypothetical protein [Pseudomonadales bacterium]
MERIALLIKETPFVEDDNFFRFLPKLLARGFQVDVLFIDTLRMQANQVEANGCPGVTNLDIGAEWPTQTFMRLDHDLVWLLGLGDRATFLDKLQLLFVVSQQTRLINSPNAIMHLKSKYLLASQSLFQVPETHADTRAEPLIRIIENKGGDWILKPPAGSLGQDVFKVSAGDHDIKERVEQVFAGSTGFAMLQQYLPEIERGEKRVLIAGGKVINQYHRLAGTDHRTNLTQGGVAKPCELSPEEHNLCTELAGYLLRQGGWFCGVDLVFPWVIEVNVINPGGIGTIDDLTGVDWSGDVVNAVLAARP